MTPRNRQLALLGLSTFVCLLATLGGVGAFMRATIDRDHVLVVAVAGRDLHPGVTIEAEDVYGLEVPGELVPAGAYLIPEALVGRVVTQRILVHDFVRPERLAGRTGPGLSPLIPRGWRAVEVEITGDVSGPGVYLDVFDASDQRCAIVQDVFVLMVNDAKSYPSGAPVTPVTLLVTPTSVAPLLTADALLVSPRNEGERLEENGCLR